MKCVFILPYFGKYKNYFELFLKTFERNKKFDLLLITDNNDDIDYPSNVHIKRMQFEQFKEVVQKKFDFTINLDLPYKLCDYKPAYGYICEEWISEYDYWGHCDCDLLFGNLDPVMKIMQEGYDKIFVAGHLTIYKNSFDNNRIFMSEIQELGPIYKRVFSDSQIFAFDEAYYKVNVNTIFHDAGKKIYENDISYNSNTDNSWLTRKAYNKQTKKWELEKHGNDQVFWKNGHILRVQYRGLKRAVDEYIYIHLQMRNMEFEKGILGNETIRVYANGFRAVSDLPHNLFQYICGVRLFFDYKKLKMKYYKIKAQITNSALLKYSKPWEYNPYL